MATANTQTSAITQTKQVVFRNMYASTHTNRAIINQKRSSEFKRPKGAVYGQRCGRRKRKGKKVLIFSTEIKKQ